MSLYASWNETTMTTGSLQTVVGSNLALASLDVLLQFNLGFKAYDTIPANDDTIILVPFVKDKNGAVRWEGDSLFLNGYVDGWDSVSGYFMKGWDINPAKIGIVVGDNLTAGFFYYQNFSTTAYYKGTIYKST